MELKTFKEIKDLKGRYLYDIFTGAIGTKIHKITSVTNNNVKLDNGITIKTIIFLENKQKNFRLATDQEVSELMKERYYDFLYHNYDIIKAMAHSPKYRFWGGNSYGMAEDYLLKQYDINIDFNYIDSDEIKEEYINND